MVLCTRCGKEKAIIHVRHKNIYLCKKCFITYFNTEAEETLKKAGILDNISGKLVTVAVSGGKDSLNTLYLMKKLAEKYGFEVNALLINEGIKGYREFTVKAFLNHIRGLRLNYTIVDLKKELGFTVDEAAKLFFQGKIEWRPCTVCGITRRYLLNKYSRELGASYLATGHNLDDEVQTVVMNILRGDIQALVRGGIVVRAEHRKLVSRIKPLHYIYERESLVHALVTGIKTPYVECPYAPLSLRWGIRDFLNRIEAEKPGFKYRLLVRTDELREKLRDKVRVVEFTECKICGEPSSKDICKTCEIKLKLNNLLSTVSN